MIIDIADFQEICLLLNLT